VIKKKEHFLGLKPLSPRDLKKTTITLGASFIKLAQVLATRADFFNESYLEELKSLHDQIPAMPEEAFKIVFNRAFPISPFETFNSTPIASASIGQVHYARLKGGEEVAVKLRRYGIDGQVHADIHIINFFNRLFRPLFSQHTKNSIEAVISEFALMIKKEVDLSCELNHLERFRQTYHQSPIHFPTPHPQYCSSDALVMSYEEGFRFDDKEAMARHKVDFHKVIEALVNFYTEQMLIVGYFHADPHPGNLLIKPSGEITMLDFGMVKSVPNPTRIATIELIKAANERDYELYISASKRLGIVAYEASSAQLAEFTEQMFEIFSNDNLSSESMQKLAFEVLDSMRELPFKLPSDAIYILRVSAIIEGLGTTYIENFNGVKDILPLLQRSLPKALGAKDSILETLIAELKDIPFTIQAFKSTLKQASEGELQVELSHLQLNALKTALLNYLSPLITALIVLFSALFTLLYDPSYKDTALVLFGIGIALLIRLKHH